QDRAEREHGRQHPGPDQFTTDGRPDDFRPAVLDAGTERVTGLLRNLHLRRIAAGLLWQPDQHAGRWRRGAISRAIERLKRRLAKIERVELRTHRGEFGGSCRRATPPPRRRGVTPST